MRNTLKGTLTEENLLKAFAGESQARMRYNYFASQASKDGYEQIAAVFNTTADQEKEHAKRFFKYLEGGKATIHHATFPAGVIASTRENLLAAAEGEHEEWYDMYPSYADIAEDEGFKEIAIMYRAICVAEQQHEERYRRLLENMEREHVFHRPEPVTWQCRKCGYTFTGKKAPDRCPACLHPKGYFEVKAENY